MLTHPAPSTSSTATRTHRVPRILAAGQLGWSEEPVRPAQADELLVHTSRSLVSPGTELAFWTGVHPGLQDPGNTWAKFPWRPGYAALGTVREVGANVSGWTVGQRVLGAVPHGAWGGYRPQYDLLAPVPEAVSDDAAPFARFLQIVAGISAALAATPKGETVIVAGGGLIGTLAALWLRSDGWQPRIEDPDDFRRELAQACGIPAEVPGKSGEPAAIVDATGIAALVPGHLERIRHGGTVVLLGSPRTAIALDIYRLIHAKCALLTGAHEMRYPTTGPLSRCSLLREALARLADGRISVTPLLTQVIAPQRLPEAYTALAARTPGWFGVALDWRHV